MVKAARSLGREAVLITTLICSLCAVTACDASPLVPEDRRPFVYLILNDTSDLDGGPVQPAFLLTMIRADSVANREAERFEMVRVSDGMPFAWQSADSFTVSRPVFGSGLFRAEANWLLADSATIDGLGRSSLEPGGTYELTIETGGHVIRGRTTIPDTFSISIVTRDGVQLAVWSTVDGAAAYAVDAGPPVDTFQTDTTYALDPGARGLSVIAIGPEVYRYLTVDTARRAGIEGALGVFGAIQRARWEP